MEYVVVRNNRALVTINGVFRASISWILVKRDDAVWLSLRKKRINTSD